MAGRVHDRLACRGHERAERVVERARAADAHRLDRNSLTLLHIGCGSLERVAPGCSLKAGAQVLEAEVLEDSVSGKLLLCLTGCAKSQDWVPALLLLSGDGQRLSGALTIPKGCKPAVETPAEMAEYASRLRGALSP